MSVNDTWQAFGAAMGEVIGYIVIYFFVLGGFVLAAGIVGLLYLRRKAKLKAAGIDPKTDKGAAGWRIALMVLLILCLVLLLPVAFLCIFG